MVPPKSWAFCMTMAALPRSSSRGVVPGIAAHDLHRALGGIVEAGNQVDKAGFCTSGTADDPYGLAGADREIDILQNGFLTVFLIAEIYMIEDDTSVWDICYRILRICDVSSIIDDFRTRSALAILIVTITKTMESIIRLMRMFMQ